jgi:hypothetical protein
MPRRKPTESAELKLRLRESLRSAIEKSARKRGRSLNQELIERLERSFDEEERLGGAQLVELIETIARVMKSTGQQAGFLETHKVVNQGRWLVLPYAFDQATKAALTVLEHHRPPGEIMKPEWKVGKVVGDPKQTEELMKRLFDNIGVLMARGELPDWEPEK